MSLMQSAAFMDRVGFGWFAPLLRLAGGGNARTELTHLGKLVGAPLFSILLFLGLWHVGASGVQTSLGTLPGPLAVRIYTPAGSGPFPLLVYFHGGGWVLADQEVYDGGARGLAKGAQAVVVSVDYRLAPEAKFPAQHDDALATYKWAVQNAASINGDPRRLALAGESAGGNLAFATAIAARDQGLTRPAYVVAVYPIAQASDRSICAVPL